MGAVPAVAAAALLGCSAGSPGAVVARNPSPAATAAREVTGAAPAPQPTPSLPAYYIETLRTRKPAGGKIEIGALMFRGSGFTKYETSWPSAGETMTGTISLPDGAGPFPVVIVNHGAIPTSRYWVGQDSGIFGDPLAAHGFIALAPNDPGYVNSGPGTPGLNFTEQIAVIDQDLIWSLSSLPQADASRVAVVGHSQGGGAAQMLMVIDPRVKAVVLHAPVSSGAPGGVMRFAPRLPSPVPSDAGADRATIAAHLSPAVYFAAGQAPVLLIQGTADHSIPASDTQATFDALQKAGVQSQLMWIPGADHDLVDGDLAAAVAAEEAWIRKSLGI